MTDLFGNESISVEEQLIYDANSTAANLSQRMFNPKLAALRATNPFVEIVPFPNSSINLALKAGVSANIDLPDQTKFIRFYGTGEYYVTRNGNASMPTTDTPNTAESSRGIILSPEFSYFYVEEIRQLSVIAPNDTSLTIACWAQL